MPSDIIKMTAVLGTFGDKLKQAGIKLCSVFDWNFGCDLGGKVFNGQAAIHPNISLPRKGADKFIHLLQAC